MSNCKAASYVLYQKQGSSWECSCGRPLTLSFVWWKWLLEPLKDILQLRFIQRGLYLFPSVLILVIVFTFAAFAAFLCSSEIFPISNFPLSRVQFSLIFRWLWHDAFFPFFQYSTLFLSILFSLLRFSFMTCALRFQWHCFISAGRYRHTATPANHQQIKT